MFAADRCAIARNRSRALRAALEWPFGPRAEMVVGAQSRSHLRAAWGGSAADADEARFGLARAIHGLPACAVQLDVKIVSPPTWEVSTSRAVKCLPSLENA